MLAAGRAGSRCRPGCEPVARMTSSAPKALMSSASIGVLSRTSTCSLVSWRSYQSRKSMIWPRRGCMPARRNWPPSLSDGFDQRDAMAALGGDPRRLEAGDAAADHQHAACGRRRRREAVAAPFEFAARRGIDQAGDPVVAIAPAPAHLVAGEAGADVLGAAVPRLVGEMRIGDLAAHDRDHVGLARGHDVVGILRRADMALGLDPGMLHHLLQRLGIGRAELVGEEDRSG